MKKTLAAIAFFAPFVAFAQTEIADSELGRFVMSIQSFINSILIPLVFSIALLVFLYGTYKYFIAGAGNENMREDGKKFMLYAIIGFVVMVSIWGIVALFAGVIPEGTIKPPTI